MCLFKIFWLCGIGTLLFKPNNTIYWTREVTYLYIMCVWLLCFRVLIVHIFIVLFFNRRWHIFFIFTFFFLSVTLCKGWGGGVIERADRIQIIRWSGTYTHIYIIYTHIYTHTYIYTCTDTYIYTHIYTYTHTWYTRALYI